MIPAIPDALARAADAHAPLPVRRTARLVLRPWRETDREPLAALFADPSTDEPTPATPSIDAYRRDAARRGLGVLAIEHRESRAFLGLAGLDIPAWDVPFAPCATLVVRLSEAARGHGYAEEAARDVLAWAFGPLRLPRVVAARAPHDDDARRLFDRLGLAQIGMFDRLADGARHAHVVSAVEAPPGPDVARVDAPPVPPPAEPAVARPRVWIDGDGAPRMTKEIVWRAVDRGAIEAILVANRAVGVPKSRHIRTVVVSHGLDVADEWLVANAAPADLVVTADIPLAAELVARGVAVVSPRGDWFTPENVGEKLSVRDFFTEARASGLVEGGGPPAMDERARRGFANALDGWITRQRRPRG